MGQPSAVVVITGDDVYEDLFGAGAALQEIVTGEGEACALRMGTGCLDDLDELALVVLYTAAGDFSLERQLALTAAVERGLGVVAVHASNVLPAGSPLADLIGNRYASHGPQPHESRFVVETDPDHPVTRGLDAFPVSHEHYRLALTSPSDVIAWRDDDGRREPIALARRVGDGRVCYVQLGHDMRVWTDPPVRTLLRNAVRWATPTQSARPTRSRSHTACQ
jgi:type 1 glutamine amidotransferase